MDRTELIMLLDLFLVRFFFNFSVCFVWWTKLATLSFLLHVKYTVSYRMYYSVCTGLEVYAECVFVLRQSLPLTIPKSTFSHSHFSHSHDQEVAGYTVAPREVFSLPSSLPSEHTSSSFVAWPVPRQVHSHCSFLLLSVSYIYPELFS